MGFSPTASTTTLTARLTPLGRKLLVTNTNSLITKFALGDGDANYNATLPLLTGDVPALGGDVGPNATTSNSSGNDSVIRYPLFLNSLGGNVKAVDPASGIISSTELKNGQTVISGSSITQNVIDRNNFATDNLVNLFVSFGLPTNLTQKSVYTATTFTNGGFSDTALSGLASDKIIVIGVDNALYGENLDGREIKLELTTTATTYTLYSTFQNIGVGLPTEDATYKELSNNSVHLGASLGFLLSDDRVKPGTDTTKSWATGFGDVKPFSVGSKELYNLQTDTNLGQTGDTVLGVAYLDKGLFVITDPTIVDEFDLAFSGASATTATVNHISTDVVQNVTCIAGRGEFGTSVNPTWKVGDTVRITEIGLFDDSNNLIAYGKFDRQVLKTTDGFASFGIKITI